MKKFFLAVLAATTLFASCSKETNNNTVVEEKAQLTIGIASTRATGTLEDNSDNTIGCFKAFVFAGDRLQAIMTSANGAAVTENAKVTTAATDVYVIANANTNTVLAGVTEGTTSKSAFLALVGNLLSGTAGSRTLAALENGKVWASGSATLTPASFTGATNAAALTVSVAPVAARINVTVDDQRTSKTATGAYAIEDVKVLNVVGDTRFIAGTYTPIFWYTGFTDGDNPTATVETYLSNAYNNTLGHRFYAFENASTTYPTIVTLVASNGTNTRYFPVHFTASDAGFGVERGKSYQVVFTLTGNAVDDPGITDPEVPIVTASLQVSVTPTNWTMVAVPKTF